MTYFKDEKLPEVFENEVLKEKIRRLNKGDESVRNEIIEHNLKLVLLVTRKFNNTGYNRDDLISIGIIGLIKSVNTFDLNKNIHFATYASRCIKNEILMFLRTRKKYSKYSLVSLTTPVTEDILELEPRDILEDSDSNLVLGDTLEDPDSDFTLKYEKEEICKEIRKFVEELPEREKYITMMSFGFDNNTIMTQKQLAKELGLSQSYVSRIIKKVLNKLAIYLKQIEEPEKEKVDPPKMKVLSNKNSKY